MLSARGRGKAPPCKDLAPVGASSCARVSRRKVALGHMVACHPLPGCHVDMNTSLFFAFFFFLDLFKHQIQNRFVFPGARDLLPLIWCGFFGGGRTGRDLLTGLGEGTGRKKEFQRDKTRGNQKWV